MSFVVSSSRPANAGALGVADRPVHAGPYAAHRGDAEDTAVRLDQAKPVVVPPRQAEDPAVQSYQTDPTADPDTASTFRPHLPAAQVHAELRRALKKLQCAERNVVLWFSEMNRRSLFRELGYASIHQYASEALGFSSNRIYRLLHLAAELERLPRLRASLAAGEIGWTKAREVAKVASAATEERWIAAARRSGRRELEQRVQQARMRAAAQRKADPAQGELATEGAARPSADGSLPAGPSLPAGTSLPAGPPPRAGELAPVVPTSMPGGESLLAAPMSPSGEPPIAGLQSAQDDFLADDAPVAVVFRLTPLQLARYEAQMECIRKTRVLAPDVTREEILLQALDQFLDSAREAVAAGHDTGRKKPAAARPHEPAAARPDGAGTAGPDEAEPADRDESEPVHPDKAKASGGQDAVAGRRTQEPTGPGGRLLPRGNNGTNYRIVIYKCALCERAVVQTQHGPKEITPGQSAAITCDAITQQTGERNGATIPPAIRQAVLSRDHHRCRAPGCRNTHYLEVHHIHPRDRGGSNRPENLVTLCSSCHRLWHERALDGLPLAKAAAKT